MGKMSGRLARSCALLLLIAASTGFADSMVDGAEEVPAQRQTLEPVEVTGKAVRDPAWMSYRDSYKAMRMFAKAEASAQLEPRLILKPRASGAPSSSRLRLQISSPEADIDLPLDRGWTTLPMNDAAVEQDAQFTLNAPPGTFNLSRVMAIRRDPQGVYRTEDLRKGCDAWMSAMRSLNWAVRLRLVRTTCVGVRWVLPTEDFAQIRAEDGTPLVLNPQPADGPEREYGMLAFRFPAGSENLTVRTPASVIAILPLLD
ncbi:hypothetical protein DBR42_15450 [Pelomonas sp. HMWF004]|nr:hypothetical protein DBR42_15450 [Pelomonas sp. HMWF004]